MKKVSDLSRHHWGDLIGVEERRNSFVSHYSDFLGSEWDEALDLIHQGKSVVILDGMERAIGVAVPFELAEEFDEKFPRDLSAPEQVSKTGLRKIFSDKRHARLDHYSGLKNEKLPRLHVTFGKDKQKQFAILGKYAFVNCDVAEDGTVSVQEPKGDLRWEPDPE
tara:strand:- start:2475 stop:2969 length:495 start_codon:yes stop_codon:yes gene_type:complete